MGNLLISCLSAPYSEFSRDKVNSSRYHHIGNMCIGFFWGAATIIISTWKKVKDIGASSFFLHVFLQFSADYPLSPVGLVLLNIFLGTGHREPDGLVKLNLYWQDSFVYFWLPAGWGKKKCLVCYLARYKLWKYGPAATWYVSISVFFLGGWKAFSRQVFSGHWYLWTKSCQAFSFPAASPLI